MAAQQVMLHFQFDHPIDIQAAGEHQIHHCAHITRIAVFDGQHSAVIFPRFYRTVGLREVAGSGQLRLGESPFGGDIAKRALDPGIDDLHAFIQAALIGTGGFHHIPEKADVIRPQVRILHPLRAAFDHCRFPVCIQNRQTAFLLILSHLTARRHAAFEKPGHFLIHRVDFHSCLLKLIHLPYPPETLFSSGQRRKMFSKTKGDFPQRKSLLEKPRLLPRPLDAPLRLCFLRKVKGKIQIKKAIRKIAHRKRKESRHGHMGGRHLTQALIFLHGSSPLSLFPPSLYRRFFICQ